MSPPLALKNGQPFLSVQNSAPFLDQILLLPLARLAMRDLMF